MLIVSGRAALAAAIGVVTMGVVLAACGGQPAVPQAPAPAPASAPVDPQAPEVNTAGDIPDNQVFVPFQAPDGSFQVSVPEGWARTTTGTATVFTDKFNSIRLESSRAPTAPTVASAQRDELPAIAAATPGYRPGQVTQATRKAGPLVLLTYTATSPADPVTGKSLTTAVERYEFWKDGQEVIVTLSGPRGADNVDPWRTVSDSVSWLR